MNTQCNKRAYRMNWREVSRERELMVTWLRESKGMRFRDIARRMNLGGQDMVRTIYARACRKRQMVTAAG